MQKILIDPEFKTLIPPQTEEEHARLEENIVAHGCRDALVLWGDILIDGHNRQEICQRRGIPFETKQAEGIQDRADALVWIIMNQLSRRNLQKFQVAELVLKMEDTVAAKAKRNNQNAMETARKNNPNNVREQFLQKSEKTVPIHTDETLGQMAGVSHDIIQKSRTIIKQGTEEQKRRARGGGKGNSVNAIHAEIKDAGVKTKVCRNCGQEKPVEQFMIGRNLCKACRVDKGHNTALPPSKPQTVRERNREIMSHIDAAVEALYDQNRAIVYTTDDMEQELNAIVLNLVSQARHLFEIRSNVLKESGAKEKMTAVLSEAETAISMLKELLI